MSSTQTMKAVNYQGAFKVKVEDVPMPKIEHPDDVVVKYGLQEPHTKSVSIRAFTNTGEQSNDICNLRFRPSHGTIHPFPES